MTPVATTSHREITEQYHPSANQVLHLGDTVAAYGVHGTLVRMERSPFGRMTFYTLRATEAQVSHDGHVVTVGQELRTVQVAFVAAG